MSISGSGLAYDTTAPPSGSNSVSAPSGCNTVFDVECTHTFNIYMYTTITTNDYILIKYGSDNHIMADTCTGGNLCVSFPLIN